MTPLIPLVYKNFNLIAKLDYVFPTGSFKDRGASVLITKVKEMNVKKIVEDSSGNAGAAISAYSAKAGIQCEIFCPSYASKGKLTQILLYGAKLNRIHGTREDTAKAVLREAKRVYYASHNWNPFFLEGTKTVAYEISEQLDWNSPDNVVCPCGNGGIYLGLHMGFKELINEGIIDKIPRLLGVQSDVCCPLYNSYKENKEFVEPVIQRKKTIAEGICLANPSRGKLIIKAMKETKGAMTIVSDREVIEGLKILSRKGIYVEPTSAVVVKALDKFEKEKIIEKDEKTVIILSGSGLKATETLIHYLDHLPNA